MQQVTLAERAWQLLDSQHNNQRLLYTGSFEFRHTRALARFIEAKKGRRSAHEVQQSYVV